MAVYILELQDECYYVGFSQDPSTRIAEHFLGRGALWAKLHPPKRVRSVIPGGKELEDPTTILTMLQYGWRSTRGGSWWCSHMTASNRPVPIAF